LYFSELYINFYAFCKIDPQTQNPKTLGAPHAQPALRLIGGAHGPTAHQPESRPTRGLDPRRGVARARCGRGGARRHSEAKPEWGRGRAHGVEVTAAKLTSGGAGGEQRREGGATAPGGCGWRSSPTAQHGGGGGRVRAQTGRGWGGLGGARAISGRTSPVAANHGGRRSSGGGGNSGADLGFGGKKEPGADKERARGGADSARIRTRARCPRMAGACPNDAWRQWRRVSCRGRAWEGEREADGWARARKILFLYFFSFWAVTTLLPLRKSRPEI
jgi:hypothetical protein